MQLTPHTYVKVFAPPPSSCDAEPEQVSGSTMTTPKLGHGSGRAQTPSSGTGLRAWVARKWAFGLTSSCSNTTEPSICGSGRSGSRPCASPMGIMPSGVRANVRPIWPVARRVCSPWGDSNYPPASVGLGSAQADGGWGVPQPRLEELCRAAAGPNLRHGLVLGLPASLRALRPTSSSLGK